MTEAETLLEQVREFRKKKRETVRALKKARAPRSHILDIEVQINNAVAMFEAFLCFRNMGELGYAAEHKQKLEQALDNSH